MGFDGFWLMVDGSSGCARAAVAKVRTATARRSVTGLGRIGRFGRVCRESGAAVDVGASFGFFMGFGFSGLSGFAFRFLFCAFTLLRCDKPGDLGDKVDGVKPLIDTDGLGWLVPMQMAS